MTILTSLTRLSFIFTPTHGNGNDIRNSSSTPSSNYSLTTKYGLNSLNLLRVLTFLLIYTRFYLSRANDDSMFVSVREFEVLSCEGRF